MLHQRQRQRIAGLRSRLRQIPEFATRFRGDQCHVLAAVTGVWRVLDRQRHSWSGRAMPVRNGAGQQVLD